MESPSSRSARRPMHAAFRSLVLGTVILPHQALGQVPAIRDGTHPFNRIRAGDWSWSSDFLTRDASLYGYSLGFVRQVRLRCSGFGTDREAESFQIGWWQQREQEAFLASVAAVTAATLAQQQEAGSHARQWLAVAPCTNAALAAFMANARRLLQGQRPLHGQPRGATLKTEKVAPVSGRHVFDDTDVGLQSPGMNQLEHDFAEAARTGAKVLECHYDADSTDGDWEVQYYWSSSSSSTWRVASRVLPLGTVAQRNLQTANGAAPVHHPFTQYGSPRDECPHRADPRLPHKTIYAPRTGPPTFNGKVTAPKVSAFKQYWGAIDVTIEYGPVPEGFVPPFPDSLPPDWREFSIKTPMQTTPGGLVRIDLVNFGAAFYDRSIGDQEWVRRPAEGKLVEEDHDLAVDLGLDQRMIRWCTSIPESKLCDQDKKRQLLNKYKDHKPFGLLLLCTYNGTDGRSTRRYTNWYQGGDPALDPARLKQRVADHPMLAIGPPLHWCPASALPRGSGASQS